MPALSLGADAGIVVLDRGQSDYESVGTMVEDLAAAFRRCGLVTALLDTRAPDSRDAATRIEAALGDERALPAIAAAGTLVQAAAHRWGDRAAALIAVAEGFGGNIN